MTYAIIGSRTFNDYSVVKEFLDGCYDITAIVSGGAAGADSLGEQYAIEHDIPYTIFRPDWAKFGKKAGYIRNADIINAADVVIAFWNGTSNGTKHSIELARRKNKIVKVVKI
jgi:hypothetical protein